MPKCYTAFGLSLEMDFPCAWLPETQRAPEVFVHLGPVSCQLENPVAMGICFQVQPRAFLFWIDGLARFLVRDGRDITVQLEPGVKPTEVFVFILGTAMGAILFQRGFLLFHGTVIQVAGRVIGLFGGSGSGKSTLAAALCQRGAKLISDDVCSLQSDGRVFAGFPGLQLWPESYSELGWDPTSAFPIRSCLSKRLFPVAFEPGLWPIDSIYLLGEHTPQVEVRPLSGRARFFALERNLYRPALAKATLSQQQIFMATSAFAGKVPIASLGRPRNTFALSELCARITENS